MKITVDRRAFLDAFNLAAGVAPGRNAKPILQNLKLVVTEDGSSLLATDLEVSIRRRLVGVTVERAGAAILPRQRVHAILSTCPDATLEIEANDPKFSDHGPSLSVRGFCSEFKLSAEDPALFPEIPDPAEAGGHLVAAADLRSLIRRTAFATDVESTRYALGGCLVERGEASLAFVATDGRRLARMSVAAQAMDDGPAPDGMPVAPLKALKLVDRAIADDEAEVRVAATDKALFVHAEGVLIHSRLIEGRFPRYQDIFPRERLATCRLGAGPFRRAVEQALIATSEESRGVDFSFTPHELRLAATSSDVGNSRVTVGAEHEGPPLEITFDARYLLDLLKVLPEEEPVVAELIDGKAPAVFRVADGYAYVVMPLTRDR